MAPRQVTSTKFLAKKLEKMKAKFDPPLDINGPATLTISSKTERHIELLEKYSEIAQKDPIKAMIEIEKDLETLTLVRNHIWRKEWKDSPHLLPKYAKNWEIINDILIKSWETQASSCRDICQEEDMVLLSGQIKDVHGMLLYYFKCLNVADDIKQVIGVIDSGNNKTIYPNGYVGTAQMSTSFLKTGFGNVIENVYSNNNTLRYNMDLCEYIDEDPAHPRFTSNPRFISRVGAKNERLLFTPDEEMEKHTAFYTHLYENQSFNVALYDVKMRKYIKEKYGVEIESLVKKWSKLCWNCFKPFEDLKKCAKCKIAVYCGKKCQAQDWKTHKIRHDLFYGCVKSLMEMPRYVNISNLESLAPKERPHRLVILANPATPI